jgi:hypothetical protein
MTGAIGYTFQPKNNHAFLWDFLMIGYAGEIPGTMVALHNSFEYLNNVADMIPFLSYPAEVVQACRT